MRTAFEQARDQFLHGLEHLQAGRAAEAEASFLASLALVPGRASSLMNLAVTRLALGRPAQAVDDLRLALQAEPESVMAWGHLGEAHLALGRADDALAAFDQAWTLAPPAPALRFHRARALAAAARPQLALDCLQPLLEVTNLAAAPAWQLAGQLLQMLGRHDKAEGHYRQALALDPALGRCWLLLGQLLQQQHRQDAASQALKQALEHGEDAELVHYLLAATNANLEDKGAKEPGSAATAAAPTAIPPASPASYVRSLFDPYAEGFDTHLVQTLRYRGHTAVADAALEDPRPHWRSVLDLGCGTGLCGGLVRSRAQRLAGVDLSPTMIEHARRRGTYDSLHADDVVRHLASTAERHDLILAADVFIYIGDLKPVMAGVRRVLQPDGRFVFSVERDEAADANLGFRLRPSLRYAHSPAALALQAAQAGLAVERVLPIVLREEEGRPIDGAVLVLRPAG
jgi:predicted TPR repeat methyltransferase